jgi:5-methylcytosine-specific restriction protein A
MRREFSTKVRLEAFLRSKGRCESARVHQLADIGCSRKLFEGDIRYEHINPDGLTGEPTLDNCAVLCTDCWKIKTRTYDQPEVARAKRKHLRSIGIKRPSRWPKRKFGT